MLVSQSRALPPGPPLWVTEREVPSRLRPALTLDKPRIGGGVRTQPVTGAQKPEARVQALVALCLPHGGGSGSVRGVREI